MLFHTLFLQPRRVQGRNQAQAELPVVLAPASPLLADVVFDQERLVRLVVAEHSYCAHVQVEFSGGSQADNPSSSSHEESEMCWLAGGEVDVPDAAVEVEVEPGCRRLDQCVSTGVTADLMKEILELSRLRAVKSDL